MASTRLQKNPLIILIPGRIINVKQKLGNFGQKIAILVQTLGKIAFFGELWQERQDRD